MNLDLKNKVVLVTGSGQGLGKGIAETFLKEEAKVVLTDVLEERLIKTSKELQSEYRKEQIFSYCGNLINSVDIQACIKQTLEHFGGIDILIANLGSGRGTIDWNITDEEWNKMLDINFTGARRITKEILPQFIRQNGGSIVFIASIAGKEIIGAPIHYSVAKAAVVAYAKNIAGKVARHNIRINTVCPGNIYFPNGTWDIKLHEDNNAVLNMLEKSVPLNRFASPEDIANLVVFLGSDKASFITGSCIVADGGQTVGF